MGLGTHGQRTSLKISFEHKIPLFFLLETWSGKKQLEKIKFKVKYEGLFTVPNSGRGGGLALLWTSEGAVWVDSFSKNHIDAVVNGGTMDAWWLPVFTESWRLVIERMHGVCYAC